MPDINEIRGIDSKRANFAFECVGEVPNSLKKNYKSYVKKMPMLVKTNGLGQTLAFYLSKNEEAYRLLLKQIRDYLALRNLANNLHENESLLSYVTSLNNTDYRVITQEIMFMLNWLRRFADGMLED